ncbi:hypothetical protein Tco_0039012 [Tanacetum coccineum]
MTNLNITEDLIYDEAGTSYDSNTPSEVHDHDTFVNHLDEYHEVLEMQTDEEHNYVVDSDADYMSNSNTILYDQYVEDNEDHAHPWFNGVKWDTLYEMEAAYKSIVTGELDTQNFEKFPKVWICQISQEFSQKRTRERMSDQEAKDLKAEAREIMPQPSTVNCKKPQSKPKPISIAY